MALTAAQRIRYYHSLRLEEALRALNDAIPRVALNNPDVQALISDGLKVHNELLAFWQQLGVPPPPPDMGD